MMVVITVDAKGNLNVSSDCPTVEATLMLAQQGVNELLSQKVRADVTRDAALRADAERRVVLPPNGGPWPPRIG